MTKLISISIGQMSVILYQNGASYIAKLIETDKFITLSFLTYEVAREWMYEKIAKLAK